MTDRTINYVHKSYVMVGYTQIDWVRLELRFVATWADILFTIMLGVVIEILLCILLIYTKHIDVYFYFYQHMKVQS